jgi:hypothetical protein
LPATLRAPASRRTRRPTSVSSHRGG